MPILEIDIEDAACKWAEKNGWLAPKLQWLNQTGWPDRTFIKNGHVIWIEFKKPDGRTSKKQDYWIKQIRDHGCNVFVVSDVDTAVAILREYD